MQTGDFEATIGAERIEDDRVGSVEEERGHGDLDAIAHSAGVPLTGHALAAQQAVLVGPDEANDFDTALTDAGQGFGRGGALLVGIEAVSLNERAYWTHGCS